MRVLPVALLLLLTAPAFAQGGASSFIASSQPVAVPLAPAEYVVLTSGERVSGEVELLPSPQRPTHVAVDGARYDLRDVASFSTEAGDYGVARHPFTGTPTLLTKSESGRVNLYEESGAFGSGLEYFQKGDARLMLVNQPNLRQQLADNPESLRHLERYGTYQKIGTGSMIAGAALVALGAYLHFDGNAHSSTWQNPLVVAGSGVLFATSVNMVIPLLQQKANRDAIRAYNR